jgi:hypothetical protein
MTAANLKSADETPPGPKANEPLIKSFGTAGPIWSILSGENNRPDDTGSPGHDRTKRRRLSMNVFSLAAGILVFAFFFEGFSMSSAVALFAALGVAEAVSLVQRLMAGLKTSDAGMLQGHSASHDGLATLAR